MATPRLARLARSFAAALLCSTCAVAQFSVSAFAHTALTVSTTVSVPQQIAAGTDISAGANLSTGGDTGLGLCLAGLITTLQSTASRIVFTVQEHATAIPGTIPCQATVGPHSTRIVITATRALRGRFVLEWIDGGGGQRPQIDLGNDGTTEFAPAGSATATIPLTLAAGTFAVRIDSGCLAAASPGNYAITNSTVRVTYEPDTTFATTPLAAACAGVAQSAEANFLNGVDLLASGLLPPGNGVGVQVFGFQPAPSPILLPFAPHCSLHTDVALTHTLIADAAGNARTTVDLSAPALRPIAFNAQVAWLDVVAGLVITSNALRVSCP